MGRWARAEDGTSLGGLQRYLLIVGNSEAFERKPKVRITVLKVGTVTHNSANFKLTEAELSRRVQVLNEMSQVTQLQAADSDLSGLACQFHPHALGPGPPACQATAAAGAIHHYQARQMRASKWSRGVGGSVAPLQASCRQHIASPSLWSSAAFVVGSAVSSSRLGHIRA